jgi:hypothetical protein
MGKRLFCVPRSAPGGRPERTGGGPPAGAGDTTMQTIENPRGRAIMTTELCPRCRFHPASPRRGGYCSWDCYDADDDEADEEGDEAA